MNNRLAIVIAIAWAALAWGSGPALAQDPALARAEEHFNKAQTLVQYGKHEEAAAEFLNAYEARELPAFLYNAGVAYEKLAKSDPAKLEAWNKAIEYYGRYIKKDPKATDRRRVQKRIKMLEGERDRIKTAVKSGNRPTQVKKEVGDVGTRGLVVIESEPSNAYIYLDDKKKGPLSKTPWSGSLTGEHTIFIERKGYKPYEKSIAPSPDKLLVLSIVLAEEDYLGWIDITSNVPGADIYIDDKAVGVYRQTPFSGNLKPGKHKIWVTSEGYDEFYSEVDIVAGQTHSINAQLKGSPVGYVDVAAEDGESAMVYVDGKRLCDRAPCRKAVQEGNHTIEVARSGHKTYERTIDVQARTEVTLRVKLAKKPSRSDAIWAYAFSAAFAGGGVYLGMRSKELYDQLAAESEAGMPPVDSSDPRFQRGKYFTFGADAAYAVSALTFMTAVYYTFRAKGPVSKGTLDMRSVALEPQLAPGYAGLGMEVQW